MNRASRQRQSGMTLLEVMVSMLVFLFASTALVLLVNQTYVANAQAMRSFAATTAARSLLSVAEGDSPHIGSLNGVQLGANATASPPASLQAWWTTQSAVYPDLVGVAITTSPNPCTATAPCQITANMTVKSAFGGTTQHTFVLQDGF